MRRPLKAAVIETDPESRGLKQRGITFQVLRHEPVYISYITGTVLLVDGGALAKVF